MSACVTVCFTRRQTRHTTYSPEEVAAACHCLHLMLPMFNLRFWTVAVLLCVTDCSQVKDAVALDAKLVPLYRLMAAECDKSAGLSTTAQHAAIPSSIADAEKVLAEHFGDSTTHGAAPAAQTTNGSQMSADEAEAILAQHFK
jgi:hypothetical protein